MEGLLLELARTSLERSFELRPESPHLHLVESFTRVRRAALNGAGVFSLFMSTEHVKTAV